MYGKTQIMTHFLFVFYQKKHCCQYTLDLEHLYTSFKTEMISVGFSLTGTGRYLILLRASPSKWSYKNIAFSKSDKYLDLMQLCTSSAHYSIESDPVVVEVYNLWHHLSLDIYSLLSSYWQGTTSTSIASLCTYKSHRHR